MLTNHRSSRDRSPPITAHLRMGVLSVGGMPLVTVIRNTVMFSIVEIPSVT